MAGLRTFTVGVALVLLFGLALFNFMGQFILINNPESAVLNDSGVQSSTIRLNASLNSLKSASDSASNVLTKAEVSPIYIFVIAKAFFDIPISIFSFITQGIILLNETIFTQIFGISSAYGVVFTVIEAILILTAVLLIIKAARTGESER